MFAQGTEFLGKGFVDPKAEADPCFGIGREQRHDGGGETAASGQDGQNNQTEKSRTPCRQASRLPEVNRPGRSRSDRRAPRGIAAKAAAYRMTKTAVDSSLKIIVASALLASMAR